MLGFAFKGGDHLVEASFGFQNIPEQLYPNQRMDMLDNEQKTFNLRYLGQYDWGLFEARAYYEKVDHYMDFGPDKRFWYGMQSGGPMAAMEYRVRRSAPTAQPACRCTPRAATPG